MFTDSKYFWYVCDQPDITEATQRLSRGLEGIANLEKKMIYWKDNNNFNNAFCVQEEIFCAKQNLWRWRQAVLFLIGNMGNKNGPLQNDDITKEQYGRIMPIQGKKVIMSDKYEKLKNELNAHREFQKQLGNVMDISATWRLPNDPKRFDDLFQGILNVRERLLEKPGYYPKEPIK